MHGGIVRQIDELGRIVIPAEVRRVFGIEDDTRVEMFLDGEKIVLKVHRPGCVFCGGVEDTREYRGRHMCRSCAFHVFTEFEGAPSEVGWPATAGGDAGAPGVWSPLPEQAAREWVAKELRLRGWQVDESGRAGRSVDLVAWTATRTWYLQVRAFQGGQPEWPTGHQLGWLKGAARRKDATAVVAFVRALAPTWAVEFWSAHAFRKLET